MSKLVTALFVLCVQWQHNGFQYKSHVMFRLLFFVKSIIGIVTLYISV